MVKIAVAGGSGELAREVIDVLIAANKHEMVILSRKASSTEITTPGVTRRFVDYNDIHNLVEALQGVHTVLSFVNPAAAGDKNNAQKNLIDASIAAGVTRFAPSEYGSNGKEDLPFWAFKDVVKEYLEKVNKKEKVLEYTLFQPGLFLNYLASPHKTSKHVTPLDTFIDFHNRRAIIIEGHTDAILTLTTTQDIAATVAQAVEYPGEWPKVGGIRGNRVTIAQILEIGAAVRGRPFTTHQASLADLEAGTLQTPWTLATRHPSFTDVEADRVAAMFETVLVGTLLSCKKGAWDVSDEWNRLLPEHRFTRIEGFLAGVWEGKP